MLFLKLQNTTRIPFIYYSSNNKYDVSWNHVEWDN